MVFVYPEEKKAVDQLAQRLEEESGIYAGWSRWTVLNPSFFKGVESLPVTPFERPRRNEIWTELDSWRNFRELLRDHHPFIETNSETQQEPQESWQIDIARHGKEFGFRTEYELGQSNFYDEEIQRRRLTELHLVKLKRDGFWAQLLDNGPGCKILGIVNERAANFFALKRFVSDLKSLLLDSMKYQFVYGHPAKTDSPPYPFNGPESQRHKRFERHSSIELLVDKSGLKRKFKISRLCKLWLSTGFQLFWSPDGVDRLCVGFMSEEMKNKALTQEPKLWAQFFI